MAATILPAAMLWLPQSCRQQYCACHNLAPAARLKQGQQYCDSHNLAAGKLVAEYPATMLLHKEATLRHAQPKIDCGYREDYQLPP